MKQLTSRQVFVGLVTAGCLGIGGRALANDDDKKAGAATDHEFQMMDTNNDGKISAEGHAAGAKKMFDQMDTNKDGKVTAAEMTAAHEQVTGAKARKAEMTASEKIKEIDTNNDGVLTAEEHADGAKKMFARMDTNNDGFLTKDEVAAGHHKLMHRAAAKEGKDTTTPTKDTTSKAK